MLIPCYRCQHGTPCDNGCTCDAYGTFIFVGDGTLLGDGCMDFKHRNRPTETVCDIYGKACMTCAGCPEEPPEEESEE